MEKLTYDIEAQSVSTYAEGEKSANQTELDLHPVFEEPTIPNNPRITTEFRALSIQLSRTDRSSIQLGKTKKDKKQTEEIADLQWHRLSVSDCLKRLGGTPKGLDSSQVERRRKLCGRNEMSKPPNRILIKIFWYIFGGFGTLLVVAAIICFLAWKPLGEPNPQVSNLALACVLLFVVAVQAIFNAVQDFSTSRIMASIAGMLPEDVQVIRDNGQRAKVPAADLVPGDLVVISLGNKIAADCRLIECSDSKFDRSVVTGEAEAVTGTVDNTDENYLESRNIALAGTSCVNGSAIGVVVATGDDTVFGRIAKMSSKPKSGLTTLEREVRYFVFTIAAIAIGIAIICVILWASFLRVKHPDFMNVSALLVNVVSTIVAFVPEGMPVAVTVSLSIVARKMAKAKVLCKQLSTCETLGAISVLCSDKTGTLTTNRMVVSTVGSYNVESTPSSARDAIVSDAEFSSTFSQIQWASAICNAATFDPKTLDLPIQERTVFGDATDCAILKMAEEMGGVDRAYDNWNVVHQIAFNSKNKFMLRLCRTDDVKATVKALGANEAYEYSASDYVLLSKGAPDILLNRAGCALDSNGDTIPLTEEIRDSIMRVQKDWSSKGQRVLVIARRIIAGNLIHDEMDMDDLLLELNEDLTIIGLVGIIDPPRHDTAEVVDTCRAAGIRFFMVTGDFQLTAESIARQCKIITTRNIDHFEDLSTVTLPPYDTYADASTRDTRAISLTGTDVTNLTDDLWEKVCAYEEIVFSRTTPDQKLRIVTEFQARGDCVGMTGDGVNDAPSLKQADIGIAMGGGSSVAMEAADMILLENFSSIIKALMYGRLLFANLRKTIGYLLPAGTMAELWAVLLSFFFGLPQILSNLQMIFVCIGTDVLPALSLVQEKPESDLLRRKPRNTKTDRLCNVNLLLQAYLFVGMPTTLISGCMAFWWMARRDIPFSDMWLKYGGGSTQTNTPDYFNEVLYEANAIYFFTLVILQWFNLFNWRTQKLSTIFQQVPILKKSTQNLYIFPAIIFALLLAIFLSYVPGLQNVFLTRGIPAEYYFLPMAMGLGLLIIDELRKLYIRTYPKSVLARIAW